MSDKEPAEDVVVAALNGFVLDAERSYTQQVHALLRNAIVGGAGAARPPGGAAGVTGPGAPRRPPRPGAAAPAPPPPRCRRRSSRPRST